MAQGLWGLFRSMVLPWVAEMNEGPVLLSAGVSALCRLGWEMNQHSNGSACGSL